VWRVSLSGNVEHKCERAQCLQRDSRRRSARVVASRRRSWKVQGLSTSMASCSLGSDLQSRCTGHATSHDRRLLHTAPHSTRRPRVAPPTLRARANTHLRKS
jgi:hypothetical protein